MSAKKSKTVKVVKETGYSVRFPCGEHAILRPSDYEKGEFDYIGPSLAEGDTLTVSELKAVYALIGAILGK